MRSKKLIKALAPIAVSCWTIPAGFCAYSCQGHVDPEPPTNVLRNVDGSDWQGREQGHFAPMRDYDIYPTEKEIVYKNSENLIAQDLVIPNYVLFNNEKYKVILQEECFFENYNLTGSIELNDFMDFVPDQCFFNAAYLRKVIFHQYPKHVGYNAFAECISLSEIYVRQGDILDPNWTKSIISIGDNAFENCRLGDEELTYSLVFGPALVNIGKYAFSGCTALVNVCFSFSPEFVELQEGAFFACWSLEKITFHDNFYIFGKNCLASCSNLENVYLPCAKQIQLSEACFSGCTYLRDLGPHTEELTFVSVEKQEEKILILKKIPSAAFLECRSLEHALWEPQHKVVEVGDRAFDGTPFGKVVIPRSMEHINYMSFGDMNNLHIVDFSQWDPDSIPDLGPDCTDAFAGKPSNGQIILPYSELIYEGWLDFLQRIGFSYDEIEQGKWQVIPGPKPPEIKE